MKTLDVNDITVGDLKVVLKGDRLILTHRGKEKFAVISIHDLQLLEAQQLESLQSEEDVFHLVDIE